MSARPPDSQLPPGGGPAAPAPQGRAHVRGPGRPTGAGGGAALKAVLATCALLALWQWGVPWSGVPAYVLPVPSAVATRFAQTFSLQMHHLGVTSLTTLAGLALSLLVGVLLALTVVYVRGLKLFVLPLLSAFNGIPKIALAPLFVIWLGLGPQSKVLLAFLLAIFPIFVGALSGLSEIEADVLDLSRLAGGTLWRIFLKVRLMHALPYLTDALKVAIPLALAGSIVGEFIGGNAGIGYLILTAQFNMDVPLVFAALLSLTLFTTAGIAAVALIERFFLRWMPSRRS
ncbi:ABC transporter permease [Castellaniella caeni]|uniref:ABC transporter permease n=1 Tax=Castellaniella caeni TaxID=266123 RepID=UPI0009FBA35D|nr:ABC transporter permease [Castellaniella caeni]